MKNSYHVCGGSSFITSHYVRVALRVRLTSVSRDGDLGFRLVRSR